MLAFRAPKKVMSAIIELRWSPENLLTCAQWLRELSAMRQDWDWALLMPPQ